MNKFGNIGHQNKFRPIDKKQYKQNIRNVSVIIPTADRSELLNRAIRSVLNQTLKPKNIIVVDNGCNDADIAPDILDQINLIRTNPKIGSGRSRNIGVRHADSYYVGFLDDDDVWEPDYLKHSLKLLEVEDADVVVGQLKRSRQDGVVRPYKMFPSDINEQRSVYYRNPGFGGQNIVIKKNLFQKVGGFDEGMPASVDRDLAAKILEYGGRIKTQPLSVAILCDHDNVRVRDNILKGNIMFIRRHWRHMSFVEFSRAINKIIIRYIRKSTFWANTVTSGKAGGLFVNRSKRL